MKTITSGFKTQIKTAGRMLKNTLTYELNNEEITITDDDLFSIKYSNYTELLKSAMKMLEFEVKEPIPLETVLNATVGLKVNGTWETLNYGNYVVYSAEKREDSGNYLITCYDKMLYSMKDYETMNITYPITIRNYINAIATHLGLTFKNASETFANYDKEIPKELYLGTNGNKLGYTFRDVLDELAQATASLICIDENDKLEIRYVNNTNDTINEDFLKDKGITFGEKFGPVNSIVLSRSGESDNVFLQDEESIEENGLCELKIVDNQIMNDNNRSDYLSDILYRLDGLEYYINDILSTGILYYELYDKFNVQIGNTIYPCLLLNDEPDLTNGLEEHIYTEKPNTSETEYKYASKDDRQRNQAYIIAKKNEAEIQALASKVVDVSNTISGTHTIQLENAHEGILHRLEITGNLSATFPSNDLYPSDYLYPSVCGIWVYNVKQDAIDWETSKYYVLDFYNLNYINEQIHDTYVYEDGKQWVERNVGIDEFGNKYALQETVIEEGKDIEIRVNKKSYITMYPFGDYDNAMFKCTYLLENEYTSTFANQVEVKSEINLLGDELEAKVSSVADEDGNVTSASLILAINKDESGATLNADKISLEGKEINLTSDNIVIESENLSVNKEGKIKSTAGEIGGFSLDDTKFYVEYAPQEQIFTIEDLRKVQAYIVGVGTLTPEELIKYDVNNDGVVNIKDLVAINKNIYYSKGASFKIDSSDFDNFILMEYDNERTVQIGPKFAILPDLSIKGNFTLSKPSGYPFLNFQNDTSMHISLNADEYQACSLNCTYNSQQKIYVDFQTGAIRCVSLTQTSKEEYKKNFEKLENAKEILKNTDIYKYNLKSDEDTDKKHIGFVIGDKFNYSQEITSKDNDSVDIYSMISVLWQVVKEQEEEIKLLKERNDK